MLPFVRGFDRDLTRPSLDVSQVATELHPVVLRTQ
jgi:hypothetical protein